MKKEKGKGKNKKRKRKRKRKRERYLKANILKLINTFVLSLLTRKVL